MPGGKNLGRVVTTSALPCCRCCGLSRSSAHWVLTVLLQFRLTIKMMPLNQPGSPVWGEYSYIPCLLSMHILLLRTNIHGEKMRNCSSFWLQHCVTSAYVQKC